MEKIFSDYRLNKEISRKSVDKLIKEIEKRIFDTAHISFTASGNNNVFENWGIFKNKKKKISFLSLATGDRRFKTKVLNLLVFNSVLGFLVICPTNQKNSKGIMIKELWGYRISRKRTGKTYFQEISHEELYEYCTVDFASGNSVPPQEEVVYCGPKGKICGWDMI